MTPQNPELKTPPSMPDRFDPFTHRLSRDVRNTLSTALARSLADEDPKIFETAVVEWLDRLSHDPCRRYVEERLRRYRQAFKAVSRLPSARLLPQIAILWNLELYFEVHEVAEEAYHAASGSDRRISPGPDPRCRRLCPARCRAPQGGRFPLEAGLCNTESTPAEAVIHKKPGNLSRRVVAGSTTTGPNCREGSNLMIDLFFCFTIIITICDIPCRSHNAVG